MRYHFIGICGAGMSAVAKLLIEQGHLVTGSDEGFYPPISLYLIENNIPCSSPYKKENIPNDVDTIVIGKHASLVPEKNEEVAEAFLSKRKILSFPEVLKEMTENRERTVVAGSYGKSTCTALISWCLSQNGVDAGYIIGAIPITPKINAHIGKAKEFILEGDEYPSSNWDSTSKFLYYSPQNLLVTALAHDHINIFPTHEEYIAPYKKLLSQVPEDGIIVACVGDETISSLLETFPKNTIPYGTSKNNGWYADNIVWGLETTFDLIQKGQVVAQITTKLLGLHNIQNIVGVSAILLETKKIKVDQLISAVASFKGIVRRLDKKSEKTTIPIYEGFGSSIDKARSAIEAIKLHFPNHRLVVIFEPHTFSWRNIQALSWYDTVFKDVDTVFLYKPPVTGEETHEQLTLEQITKRIEDAKVDVHPFETKDDGINIIMENITENDVVLILSSGGMDGLMPELIKNIEEKFPI